MYLDVKYHLHYFKQFSHVLKKNGYLIICTSNEEYGFKNVYDEISEKLFKTGYKLVLKKELIPIPIYLILNKFAYNYLFYKFILHSLHFLNYKRIRNIFIYKKII